MIDGALGLPVVAAQVFHYTAANSIVPGSVEDVPDPVVRQYLTVLSKDNVFLLLYSLSSLA